MKQKRDMENEIPEEWRQFEAEAAYAESMFHRSMGDMDACIASVKQSLEIKPDYPPAIMTMGTIEYQLGRKKEGIRLFMSLLSLPDEYEELCEVIDEAGDFLIKVKKYAEGLELYEAAVRRFPDRAFLYQGLACCAGNEGMFDKAVEVSRKAVKLEPDSQKLINDLGWSLLEAGRLEEAEETLQKAVEMDPSDKLARENLRLCKEARSK